MSDKKLPLNTVIHGDCLKVGDVLPDRSVDVTITDVPYQMGSVYTIDSKGHYCLVGKGSDFMNRWEALNGRWWDKWFGQQKRILKYGGYLVIFNIDRQSDMWTYYARRNGFTICQKLYWMFLSGFPKCGDASKIIDRMQGQLSEIIEDRELGIGHKTGGKGGTRLIVRGQLAYKKTKAVTVAGKRFKDFRGGIAPLSQVFEEILVFRAPLRSDSMYQDAIDSLHTENIHPALLDVNPCRIKDHPGWTNQDKKFDSPGTSEGKAKYGGGKGAVRTNDPREMHEEGGYPTQLLVSEDAKDYLNKIVNPKDGTVNRGHKPKNTMTGFKSTYHGKGTYSKKNRKASDLFTMIPYEEDDFSTAFYCAKASSSERNAGLKGMPKKVKPMSGGAQQAVNAGKTREEMDEASRRMVADEQENQHNCVKPLKLMRWLVKLFSQPGQVIYDPFAGSGSTLIAAMLEKRKWFGVELDPTDEGYIEMIKRRVKYYSKGRSKKLGRK